MSNEAVIQVDANDEKKANKKPGRNPRKGKKIVLFRFGKVRRRKERSENVRNSGTARFGFRCYLCMKQSPTLDESDESRTSDPNSSEFTSGMLRALIERNDFFSKDCSTHFDLGSGSGGGDDCGEDYDEEDYDFDGVDGVFRGGKNVE